MNFLIRSSGPITVDSVSEISLCPVLGGIHCREKEGELLHNYPNFTTKHLFKTELIVLLQFGILIFSVCYLEY